MLPATRQSFKQRCMDDLIQWLLDSPEPWTRYYTLVDLMSLTENNPEVVRCRSEHVCDVLRRFAFVHADPRFTDLLDVVVSQADAEGRYTAGSMYQAWKGWLFSDKRSPSPWMTYLVLRVQKRVDAGMK